MAKKSNGGKKVSQKKLSKAQWAWAEQLYLEIDGLKLEINDIKQRLEKNEKTIKYICDFIELNNKGEVNGRKRRKKEK